MSAFRVQQRNVHLQTLGSFPGASMAATKSQHHTKFTTFFLQFIFVLVFDLLKAF